MYSFLQPVANFISGIISALYNVTVAIGFPSYALAIILISIILKIVLYPLMQKQMKSTMNMQEVQPKLEYLQKKYKNNPEKMNQEVMKLYKEYDVNPMAGCLPLLIQFPILIGLFMALREYQFVPIEHAVFFWVPNLSEADPLHILPILVAATMFLQQKLSMAVNPASTQQNSMMTTMLYLMPAMMLFVCWSMPAGLCLYWAFFSILSIIQQYFMNKKKAKEIAAREAREAAEKEKRIAEKKAKMIAKKSAEAKAKKNDGAASEKQQADETKPVKKASKKTAIEVAEEKEKR